MYDPSADPTDYGVDVSFPMHYPIKKNLKSADPLKRMFAQRYEDHINACYKKYSFRDTLRDFVPGTVLKISAPDVGTRGAGLHSFSLFKES